MTYSKPKVNLEKYTLAESIMANAFSSPVVEEDDPNAEIQSVSSNIIDAFGEALDFSK